jgi:hypothetical protein
MSKIHPSTFNIHFTKHFITLISWLQIYNLFNFLSNLMKNSHKKNKPTSEINDFVTTVKHIQRFSLIRFLSKINGRILINNQAKLYIIYKFVGVQ